MEAEVPFKETCENLCTMRKTQSCDLHPLLQEKYTGLETARLWKPFFLSFLAKTKREQPLPGQVYGEIWPHSLQFWLHNFSNFWVKIGALVRPHLSSWTGFDLPIILGVKF